MPKFRKRPVVIEAVQLTERTEIPTLEGVMVGNPGDWLITGVKGEQYPCKPDIFEATYEVADAPTVEQAELTALRPWAEIGKRAVDERWFDAPYLPCCQRSGDIGHAPDCLIPALLAQLEDAAI